MVFLILIVLVFVVFLIIAFSRSETKNLDNHKRYRKAQKRSFRGK